LEGPLVCAQWPEGALRTGLHTESGYRALSFQPSQTNDMISQEFTKLDRQIIVLIKGGHRIDKYLSTLDRSIDANRRYRSRGVSQPALY
jgi:hypothetical protein